MQRSNGDASRSATAHWGDDGVGDGAERGPDGAPVATTPLGIYVHVPFCVRRCGYCSFSTVAVGEQLDRSVAERFVRSAGTEIALADSTIGPDRPPLTSVYVGGGTPTMLSAAQLGALLERVRERFEVLPDLEVTVESNPDSLVDGQLDQLVELGVTRISFGLQSIRARVLELLDRTHRPEQAFTAVAAALAAGIDHVSLDLIHGTPGERAADWDATLDATIRSGVDHVSAYALSIEPGTKLAGRVRRGELPPPSDDEAADRYIAADEALSTAGFEWYELSNWSRSIDARCRHNLLYWRNHHWWGIGPSAHSHLAALRWSNHAGHEAWTRALEQGEQPGAAFEVITPDERRTERLMLGVRLAEGVALRDVPRPDRLEELTADGLTTLERGRVVLTPLGRRFADLVARRLL